jgi:glycosyltransferase involved in cell wall biosynthesis
MPPRGADIPCQEGDPAYDVRWPWNRDDPGDTTVPGLTCVFRVKDEARNLPWVLPSMLAAVDHVVLVDNGSTDGTAELARRLADESGAADRYTGTSYPHRVSRAGSEHLATPPDSVHSLTHFYNWSFAHVRTTYSMKWDGDMALTPDGIGVLRDLAWQLQSAPGSGAVVAVPRHPMVVVDESTAYLDLGSRFLEPWIYPMGPDFTFVKAFEWEVREWPATAERIVAPEGLCVEIKWLDADELAHWSPIEDFPPSRVQRKRREQEVDRAIRAGRAEEVEGIHRVDAPAGVHVVDHVLTTWLRDRERPIVRRAARFDV